MGTGLKEQWGVGAPAKAGSDKQSQQFQAAFQREIGVANGHLQYTAANADAEHHNPLEARRDALYPAFQAALAQIDRTDPSKAKGAIDQVLADVKTLCTETAALHKSAEKALNDWKARQPKFDAAVHQVEEMEAWGYDKAPTLRTLVDAIRTHTNDRTYAQASLTLDALLPKLKPLYEDFQKQKAAQPKYEQMHAEQTARLDALKAAEKPSQPMTAKAGEADSALGAAKGKADAKDFVGAVEQMKTVQTTIDALDKLAKDPARTKFLADRKTAEEAVKAAEDKTFKTLQADWDAVTQVKDQADQTADSGDYAGANKLLGDLKVKIDEFKKKLEEKKKQKQAYDDALTPLQTNLKAAAETKYKKLETSKQEIATLKGQMEKAAKSEDFVQALKLAQDLVPKLEAFAKALAELEKQKKDYEDALKPLTAKIAEVLKKQYLNLVPKQQEITKGQQEMTATAQSEDFVKALQQAKDLMPKVEAYLAAAAKEVEPPIMGSAQADRADKILKKMSPKDQEEVQKLMDSAKSEPEKQFLLKGVAAGHSVKELQDFAKKIQGKDATWMRNNLSLTGSSTGRGVEQQWKMSCNATAVEAVKGQMDPLYALKMHEENPNLDQADNADATKKNPKLAEEQKAMLESAYAGKAGTTGKKGEATNRGDSKKAAGRWADDLLNNASDTTGVTYTTKKMGGGTTVSDAIKSIDGGVSKGQPVPIVIGNSPTSYTHYVVVTGMDPGPPKRYTIHNPGDGTTSVVTEAQITSGTMGLSGGNQISAFEDPSTKEVK